MVERIVKVMSRVQSPYEGEARTAAFMAKRMMEEQGFSEYFVGQFAGAQWAEWIKTARRFWAEQDQAKTQKQERPKAKAKAKAKTKTKAETSTRKTRKQATKKAKAEAHTTQTPGEPTEEEKARKKAAGFTWVKAHSRQTKNGVVQVKGHWRKLAAKKAR